MEGGGKRLLFVRPVISADPKSHTPSPTIPPVAQTAPLLVPLWLLVATAVAVWACLAAWGVAIVRWGLGLPVLPYQPRRPAPWRGIHLALILAVYLTGAGLAALLAETLLPDELTHPPAVRDVEKSSAAHTVERLLGRGDLGVLWVCALSAVLVAPIVEEFFFRVLLQDWLVAGQRRLAPRMPTLRRWVPGALGPILLTAFLFARSHFRVEAPMPSPSYVTLMLAADGAAKLLAMTFGVVVLRAGFRATPADLGWVREKFFADVRLGLFAFAALAAPVYAMQLTLGACLPSYLAPDPFVLLPFAVALGVLYHRTHRIVPAIVLHMSLNATSLTLGWLMFGK